VCGYNKTIGHITVTDVCSCLIYTEDVEYSSKGKAIPLQALTGPEGFRRLKLPDFKTFST
jgi:hypothetical protein